MAPGRSAKRTALPILATTHGYGLLASRACMVFTRYVTEETTSLTGGGVGLRKGANLSQPETANWMEL